MKEIILNVLLFICLLVVSYLFTHYLIAEKFRDTVIIENSAPVEEMYHRQLITTLDSILDARFGPGCCEEDIDTVDTNTFHTRFGGSNLSPID